MIHLEETPWWICDEGDYNFCAYVDTDSNYFNAEPLLKHLHPDFESKTDEEKDIFLKDFANSCDEMMKNPACDTDDDYKAIAEQVKMFR